MNLTKTPYLVLFVMLGAVGVTAVSAVVLVTVDNLTVTGDTKLDGKLLDTNNDAGASGQVLSSIETGIDWINAASGPQGPAGPQGLRGLSGPAGSPGPAGGIDRTCFGVSDSDSGFVMTLKLNADGNLIEGDSDIFDQFNTIEVFGRCHELSRSPELGSSQFVIVKKIDTSTPLLYEALALNQLIEQFELKFFRLEGRDRENTVHYFTIFGDNGRIISVNQVTQDISQSGDDNTPFEEVTFVFRRIAWNYISETQEAVLEAAGGPGEPVSFPIGLDLRNALCPPPSGSFDLQKFMSISTIEGDAETDIFVGTIEVFSVCFDVVSPTDPNSGNPTGPLTGGPVTISKIIDKASVPLYQALINDDDLGVIVIDFIRPSGGPEDENYYRMTLKNAKVSSIAEVTPKSVRFLPSNPHDAIEEVSFVFSKIILEDLVGGNSVEILGP